MIQHVTNNYVPYSQIETLSFILFPFIVFSYNRTNHSNVNVSLRFMHLFSWPFVVGFSFPVLMNITF